jgi:ABC-type transporter Mla subunit MlaD
MNPQLKRICGLLLVIISIVSLIISAVGLIGLWSARSAVTVALQDTAALITQTVATTQEALKVADTALQNAAESLQVLSGSTDSLANSIGSTQNALNSVTMLVRQDLPKTIEAARTALTSAQSTARVVDNFLGGLSGIQFLNINYNPDVPLAQSIGDISASLSGLPAQLTKLGGDLDDINTNLPAAITTIRGLGGTLEEMDTTLTNAHTVLNDYADQLKTAHTALQPIGDRVPMYVTLFIAVLSFIMLWIIAVQLITLALGLQWFKFSRRDAEPARV